MELKTSTPVGAFSDARARSIKMTEHWTPVPSQASHLLEVNPVYTGTYLLCAITRT